MPDRLVLGTLVGFALVVGSMAIVRLRRRWATTSIDDPSILLAAPPEGMTPATAAKVDGAPERLSVIAALLDLASRGEIGFVEENVTRGVADVGIRIGGIDPTDPRIQQNRRQPAGEAEAWLLGQLELAAGHGRHAPWDADALLEANVPFLFQTGASMVGAVLHESAETPEDQMSAAATEERQHGLLTAVSADPATIARAYTAQTGRALPARVSEALAAVAPLQLDRAGDASSDQAEGAAPAGSGTLQTAAIDDPDVSPRLYISARDARALTTPMLFGTFLETYARRHGWLGSLPFVTRLRWRITGVVAAAIGIVLLSTGVNGYSDAVTGLGLGSFVGGLVMFLLAPSMVLPTVEGGRVRAQLAAYRRTLQMTLRSASSIADAVGPTGLAWLSTPDQAIAWAVALGLAPDVETLLARSTSTTTAGTAPDVPAWYRRAHRRGAASKSGGPAAAAASVAEMFAGIEAFGSTGDALPGWLRPMRSWWPA